MVTEIRTLATSVHGGQDCPGRTMRELSGMIKLFCVLREVLGTWAYTFVKSNQTTELRSVPFNVCNLCQYIIKKYRKHIKHKNACLLHKERRKERKRNRQKGNFFPCNSNNHVWRLRRASYFWSSTSAKTKSAKILVFSETEL